jgi:hypothetical protein
MEYRPEEAKVTCCSKDRKEKKSYDAPEWLAAMGNLRHRQRYPLYVFGLKPLRRHSAFILS